MSVIVCFAPGTGGNFVSGVVRYMYQRINIPLGNRGDAHGNGIPKITPTRMDNTLESYLEERELLLNSAKQPIIKAHVRNIPLCLDIADKVVYINFQENSIPQITLNYFRKNNITLLPEHDYDNIRGKDWPSYQQYTNGEIPDELGSHQIGPSHDWYWILPIDQHRLHKIEFIDLFNNSEQWIHDLAEFLQLTLDPEQQQYLLNTWTQYKMNQPILKITNNLHDAIF